MIRAYILIETSGGQAYRYVRDVLTDSNGVAEKFYRYEGNGYQEFNITLPSDQTFSPLQFDVLYSISINVDAGGATDYSFSFPSPSNEIGVLNIRNGSIRYFHLIDKLNQVSDGAFKAEIKNKDIRITSAGSGSGTSISLAAGSTGTDLLAALNSTPSLAVAGDAYSDQSGAGTIVTDLGALTTSWTGAAGLLEFPESAGASTTLIRKNYLNGADDPTITVLQLLKSNIVAIKAVEEIEEHAVYKP